MVLEYAAGGELFDLIARKEKVSKYNPTNINLLLAIWRRRKENFPINNIKHWVLSLRQNCTQRS